MRGCASPALDSRSSPRSCPPRPCCASLKVKGGNEASKRLSAATLVSNFAAAAELFRYLRRGRSRSLAYTHSGFGSITQCCRVGKTALVTSSKDSREGKFLPIPNMEKNHHEISHLPRQNKVNEAEDGSGSSSQRNNITGLHKSAGADRHTGNKNICINTHRIRDIVRSKQLVEQ